MVRHEDRDTGYIILRVRRPHMRVDAGDWTLIVGGSTRHGRDPRPVAAGGGWEGFTPPSGKVFCSHPYHDDRDDGGWVDRDDFAKDATRASGRHPYCNACRARHRRRMYALLREAEGKQVRQWKRRGL